MPRSARKKSDTGSYHILLRGIDRQRLFRDPEDYKTYLDILKECKALSDLKVYAYCLMENHIHLLINSEREDIGVTMKRIGVRFVQRINRKYGRTGPLFQDRYKSEAVDNDKYFLDIVRYIHQDPVKSKLEKDASGYRYSSYKDYLSADSGGLADSDYLYSIISREQYEEMHKVPAEGKFLEYPGINARLSDLKAVELIKKTAHISNAGEMARLEPEIKDSMLRILFDKGVSLSQITRLTGIPKGHAESVSRRVKSQKR